MLYYPFDVDWDEDWAYLLSPYGAAIEIFMRLAARVDGFDYAFWLVDSLDVSWYVRSAR